MLFIDKDNTNHSGNLQIVPIFEADCIDLAGQDECDLGEDWCTDSWVKENCRKSCNLCGE